MVRLSRTRRADPIITTGCDAVGAKYAGRSTPAVGQDVHAEQDTVLGVPMHEIIPSYDERKQLLPRDALASVDAFWIIFLATYEHLFGLRVCPRCPDCNHGEFTTPCQDLLGSNATTAGGVFGRLDAAYTAVEAQKSTGSLHAHSQLFVQCLHQHTPLADIMERLRTQHPGVIDRYLNYSAHVSRTVYEEVGEALEERLELKEQEWPEFKQATAMTDCPHYLRSSAVGKHAANVRKVAR